MKPPLSLFERLSEWSSMGLGLERVKSALQALGEPHLRYPHILIGGTNGKGTVCRNISAGLSGKIGTFLSPHVYDIRERILLNGQPVTDTLWQSAFQHISQEVPGLVDQFSYFEWTFLLAVVIFEKVGVDYGVFEVGLGGRLDATNTLEPIISAITNVSLEHQQLLGNTLSEIAREKLAIGRPNKPFLIPSDVWGIKGVLDFLIERELTPQIYENKGVLSDNFELAKRIVRIVEPSALDFPQVALPGRREFINLGRGVYLDGAHNLNAWSVLREWCRSEFCDEVCVVGSVTSGRKPLDFVNVFKDVKGGVWRFNANYERECDVQEWPDTIRDVRHLSIGRLLERPLLVCGSLYMLHPFKCWMSTW